MNDIKAKDRHNLHDTIKGMHPATRKLAFIIFQYATTLRDQGKTTEEIKAIVSSDVETLLGAVLQ